MVEMDELTKELAAWGGWYANTPVEPTMDDVRGLLDLAHRINDERVRSNTAVREVAEVHMLCDGKIAAGGDDK